MEKYALALESGASFDGVLSKVCQYLPSLFCTIITQRLQVLASKVGEYDREYLLGMSKGSSSRGFHLAAFFLCWKALEIPEGEVCRR